MGDIGHLAEDRDGGLVAAVGFGIGKVGDVFGGHVWDSSSSSWLAGVVIAVVGPDLPQGFV